jgi:chemotaxis protein MotB
MSGTWRYEAAFFIGRPKKSFICLKFFGKEGTMRILKFSGALIVFVCALILMNGCVGEQEYKDLRIRNNTQRKRITELESQAAVANLKLDQLKRRLETAEAGAGVETNALNKEIAALEKNIEDKKALIALMRQQLLFGGAALPVELSTMLEDFAKDEEMVAYDSSRGIVKFKSDLLFQPGSDTVAQAAIKAIKSLCDIMNSEEGKKFDVIIAGHTDDIPIGKPATRAKHPTNWHLSAHRAIAVMRVMANNNIGSKRMSVRGFGEFRPIAPNKPGKKGNPQNRRVEIYIVPEGV